MAKVLIIEDNELNRDMLRRRLEQRGYQTIWAADGPTGVRCAHEEQPDVILMDLALGDMDGWHATRLIQANPKTAQIPVIAVTGQSADTLKRRSGDAAFREYEMKPVDIDRLVSKIEQFIPGPDRAAA